MIEFIESDRAWLFPLQQFRHAVLLENPEHRAKKTLPPDLLRIYFAGAEISLLGWRLEQVSAAIATGLIVRIHAEKHLGNLILNEPWVSDIHVEADQIPI